VSLLSFTPPLTKTQRVKVRRDFTKALSRRIREVRKEKGLTQQKLAEEADLHLTYVAHLEYGKYHPTVFVLWKIAKALGVTLNDLTHG
jgi:transcriptional regulator with XRE-family HTH domain